MDLTRSGKNGLVMSEIIQAESPAPAGGQIARVYVWCVAYIFNRAENSAFRFIADVARLIDDVRDGGG